MAHQHWKNFEHNALPKGLNNWRVIKLKPQGLYFLLMMEELSTWAPVDIMFPFLIDMLLPPKRLVCKTNSTELYMGMHKHASLFHTLKKCLQPTAQTLHQGNWILQLLGIVQIQYSSYIKNLPYFFPQSFCNSKPFPLVFPTMQGARELTLFLHYGKDHSPTLSSKASGGSLTYLPIYFIYTFLRHLSPEGSRGDLEHWNQVKLKKIHKYKILKFKY